MLPAIARDFLVPMALMIYIYIVGDEDYCTLATGVNYCARPFFCVRAVLPPCLGKRISPRRLVH